MKYWSGSKRYPDQKLFDSKDPDCFNFVFSTANLFAFNCKIKGMDRNSTKNRETVKKMADKTKPKAYVKQAVVEMGQKEEKKVDQNEDLCKNFFEASKVRIAKFKKDPAQFEGVDFEKDVDENYHIDFIHYASDCRAFNYKLKDASHSREKSKLIAGKILAAVLTTTAAVTGLCGAEIMKCVQGETDIKKFKSGMMKLDCNSFTISKPYGPKVYKGMPANEVEYETRVVPAVYNTSTRIEFDATGLKTLNDLD